MKPSQCLSQFNKRLVELHFSSNTRRAYTRWARNLFLWCKVSDTSQISAHHISSFLSHLCTDQQVRPSTQNQAQCALQFLIDHVLHLDDEIPPFQRCCNTKPELGVLQKEQAHRVFGLVAGRALLIGQLMYYAGLKLHEVLQLRLRDLDFELLRIAVRDRGHTHYTILPPELKDVLQRRCAAVKRVHLQDSYDNIYIEIRGSFAQCSPDNMELQYLFPGTRTEMETNHDIEFRPTFSASPVYKAYRRAFQSLGLDQNVSCHSLRHSFGIRMVKAGYSIKTIGRLMGHKDRRSTKIYEHWLQRESFSN